MTLLQKTMGADFDKFFFTEGREPFEGELPEDTRSNAQIARDEVRAEQAIDHAWDNAI